MAIFQDAIPFTKIPNWFLDEVMTTLSPTELRVMLYVYRHTLGYNKLADRISYDQFQHGIVTKDGRRLDSGAGVSRRALVTALAALEQRGFISRHHDGFAVPLIELTPAPEQITPAAPAMAKEEEAGVVEANQVQTFPVEEPEQVQKIHPTKENHLNQKKENRAAVAVSLILNKITGITRKEAEKLVTVAFRNGRNEEYIERLVEYVSSNAAIHIPAAVFTSLVKSNQDRTTVQSYTDQQISRAVAPVPGQRRDLFSAYQQQREAKVAAVMARFERENL